MPSIERRSLPLRGCNLRASADQTARWSAWRRQHGVAMLDAFGAAKGIWRLAVPFAAPRSGHRLRQLTAPLLL
jgi:hypothetical protein